MIEIHNSFDLMTNMHHTNPQLVEISNLTQQNAQLRQSSKLWKFAFAGLLIITVLVVLEMRREKPSDLD